ncbi:MAG: ribosome silencing factor [Nitrospinae bacterium CG11_big_fil_rev_8_21_14_0_20_56_8]|nr:MAG: ribosome silencing factor [Nitrospinae bacterium CG11_big_fil_rev_8_21_14_0_20_56_8]
MKESLTELQQIAVSAAKEKKAFDIVLLDLRTRTDITDGFMIASGNTRVQVQAIVDSILEKIYLSPFKVYAIEGYSTGNWVVLDLDDLMVHVFQKDARIHYDLERLWGDVPVIRAVGE